MILSAVRSERFVGRREELSFLLEEFAAACDGRARFVAIEGEAGIGKSRLVAEFVASLGARATVVTGQCGEHIRSPYLPFATVLPPREPGMKKGAFFESALQSLQRESEALPVVAVIDDLQWADSASLELLRHLMQHLRTARVLMIPVLRTDASNENVNVSAFRSDALRNRANIVQMHGLRRNEVRSLVQLMIAEREMGVPPEAASQIEILSEGNPLFVEELVRAALVTGRLGVESDVPFSIRTMLDKRLAQLSASERAILIRTAIIGQKCDAAFVATIIGESIDTVLQVMQRAVECGIVVASRVSPHEFSFRHALIRQTLAEALILGLSAPLHLRIAQELQALPDANERVAELAFHWTAARVSDRARFYNERAAEAAVSLYAYRDAIGFYSAALQCDYEPGLARADIYEKLGTLLYIDGCGAEPAEWFERARAEHERFGAMCGVAHALVLLADQYWVDARTAESLEAASRAAAILGQLDNPQMLAEARLCLARFFATLGDAGKAMDQLSTAEPALASCELGLRASFYEVRAQAFAALGNAGKALEDCNTASLLAQESGISELIAQVENNYALIACDVGEIDLAVERHKLALSEAHRTSMMWRVAYSALNYAMTLMLKGDLDAARKFVTTALESGVTTATLKTKAASVGIPLALMLNDRQLLRACSGEDALSLASLSTEPQRIASVGAAFAELRFSQGDVSRAHELLADALVRLERLHRGWSLVARVGLHGSAEQIERVRGLIGVSRERPRVVRLHRALLEANACKRVNPARSVRLAGIAAKGFASSGYILYQAIALEAAGEQAAALRIYERIGNVRDAERLRSAPARLAAVPAETVSLSARQAQIAHLVADGDSNKTIAGRLHISENTVEHHLSSIFTRLKIKSRSQLAARIVRMAEIQDTRS
ncbi:MAG: AAA family ATPase [Candidatus Eremiobacteraeota bacterium]|nr:AAA family ATPase [Candidatus Eremiobacteraeota bacterium]